MTKKLSDKEKAKRSYIREFRKASPEGLGPYNIIWESKDPRGTAHARVDPKIREIRIPEKFTKDRPGDEELYGIEAGAVLGHEIAHTRLLKSIPGDEWPEGVTQTDLDKGYEGQMYVWREVDAVLYQLAKGQSLERWLLLGELHDATTYFEDGSLKGAQKIAKKILQAQVKRGHITKEQSSKAIKEIDAIEKTEWDQYEGTVKHTIDYDPSEPVGNYPIGEFEKSYGRNR